MKKSVFEKIISLLLTIMMVLSYVPPLISYAEGDSNTSVPTLVSTQYETNDTVVADYVIKPAGDSSIDMYSTIQDTLNACYDQGGGTVFLEEGIYYISRNITIPKLCTLRGDYQDPDKNTGTLEYGTIIVADVNNIQYSSSDMERTGLFNLSNSSGVIGITVYYKNQSITNPVEQPWTFYYGNKNLMTIKNVTMINSYRGIGRSTADGGRDEPEQVHEMLMIENVKGTVLMKGVVLHNSSDVGTVTGLSLQPNYWSTANLSALGESGTKPSSDTIISKIKSMNGKGLILTDIEQQQFANITIVGYKYGVYIPKDDGVEVKIRAHGSGLMYNLNISNCNYGIMAEDGHELDWRCGYYITNSYIEGSEYALYNKAVNLNGKAGTLQLNDVTLKGKVGGTAPIIYYSKEAGDYVSVYDKVGSGNADGIINNTGDFSNFNLDRKTKTYGNNFMAIEAGSSASIINAALDYVGSNGGGVVYLKSGLYEINQTIVVPENTELRGVSGVSSRIAGTGEKYDTAGSVIGGDLLGTVINVKTTNSSAVNLNGDNSGVSGILFAYEDNIENVQKANYEYSSNECTIISHGKKGVYIKNVTIIGSSHGIGLDNCDYYTISNYVTGVFEQGILIVGGNNGLIENCLQNSTVLSLNGLYDFNGGYFGNLLDITHDKLINIYLQNAKNVEMLNTFAYGANKFLVSIGSESYLINSGLDGYPAWLEYQNGINTSIKSPRYMFYFDGNSRSDSMIVNALRINGTYGVSQVNGDYGSNNVGIYNRGSLGPNRGSLLEPEYEGERENDLRSDIFRADDWTVKQYNDTKIEANTDFSGSSNMLNVTNKKDTPYYSVNTEIDELNYSTVGGTSIPTIEGREEGIYTVYYYIPETNGYYERKGSVSVTIEDIVELEATVSYNPTTLTNQNVTAIITANKELQEISDWVLSTDKKKLTRTYKGNVSETVTITDLAGNTENVEISITNIDKEPPAANIFYSTTELTNEDVTVKIIAYEPLQDVEGWEKSTNGKILTRTYDRNTEETVTITDLAGNTETKTISISNIDKESPTANVSYNITNPTNDKVKAIITAYEEIQEVDGWILSSNKKILTREYTENTTETVTIKDLAGNETTVTVKITNIDKEAPTANVSYSTLEPTNGNVTATITINEEIQNVNGWTISSNGKVLTREYAANVEETVTIKDLAGNTTLVEIKISNINKEGPTATVSYNTLELTNQNVTVTITANKELQDVNGWTKSNDGKVLTKVYTANISEEVIIKDLVGNQTTVTVTITNIDKDAPTTSISYSNLNPTNGDVTATITLNEAVQEVKGWTKSSDGKVLTKAYTSNATEIVVIKDLVGNQTTVTITITNIDKEAPTTSISYSTINPTNGDVTATITLNEAVQDVSGWTKSNDGKVLTKVYTSNATERVVIKDLVGNQTTVTITITNIDKEAPTTSISYSTINPTNGDVTATITLNEAVQDVSGWTKSNDGKVLTKVYTSNATERVVIKDLVGNQTTVTITITNIDKEAPTTSISYSTINPTNGDVTATITLNEAVQDVSGWTKSNDGKVLTKVYTSNATERVVIKDLVGNQTTVTITITNIDKEAPTTSISYSTINPTNGDVTATITLNEAVQDVSGWTKSSDGKVLTKVYTSNTTERVVIKDLVGNQTTVTITISNIDKEAPTISIDYSIVEPTNSSVTATITANEEIQSVTGWSLSNDKKKLSRIYTANTNETIEIKDLVGNTVTAKIIINNIDTTAPVLSVSYSTTEPTNGNVTATITANEEVQDVNGWTKSSDGKVLTKTYSNNVSGEKVVVKDLVGNESTATITIANIDTDAPVLSVSYSTTNITNQNVTATITADKQLQEVLGWNLSNDKKSLTKEYTENITETVTVTDLVGNTSTVTVTIGNIDKTAPTATVNYSTTNITNQNVTATITADEQLQEVTGWSLSDDKKVLTRTYTENANENVIITDLAGNNTNVIISIVNIDKEAPILNVSYNPITATNGNVTATITSNEEVQEVIGWSLSNDKKILTKIYSNNISGEKVVVKDLVGNESTATITITNIDTDAPILNVSYSTTNPTNQNITATITANKELQEVTGWNLSDDKKILTKEYTDNTTEIVTVMDLVGNSSSVTVTIDNIDKEAPILNVNYNPTIRTNGNVEVTIISNEQLQQVDNWILSNDKKELTKTYTENVDEIVIVKDLAGNSTEVKIVISNIKKPSKGDLNENEQIDLGDILILQRHIAQTNSSEVASKHLDWKLSEEKIRKADLNNNGKVDIGDILILQRYIAANNDNDIAAKHPAWLEI